MTSGVVNAKGFLSVPVEFNCTFKAAPKVVISEVSGSGNTSNMVNSKVVVITNSVTAAGFTARFYNNTSNNISSFVASWIAVYAS